MSKKTEISFLGKRQLEKLSTKRLLALKKTVVAKKSAIWHKNVMSSAAHPFDLNLSKIKDDREEYRELDAYYNAIKGLLDTRENLR